MVHITHKKNLKKEKRLKRDNHWFHKACSPATEAKLKHKTLKEPYWCRHLTTDLGGPLGASGLPQWLSCRESPCNAGATGDAGLIPGLGRSPEGWHGNLLQNAGLENSMDRGAWWATVHRVRKSRRWLNNLACMHTGGNCKILWRTRWAQVFRGASCRWSRWTSMLCGRGKGTQKERHVCWVPVQWGTEPGLQESVVASLSQSRAICGRGAEDSRWRWEPHVRSRLCSGLWGLIGSRCGFLSLCYDKQPGLKTGLQWGKLDVGTMALRLLQTFRHR